MSCQLRIYSKVNGCISKVCAISCQVRTTAFLHEVQCAGGHRGCQGAEDNHMETTASAQAPAINRHLEVTCIKSNK